MNPGFIRCPLCGKPTKLTKNGFLRQHFSKLYKQGMGFRGNSDQCNASNKKPEEL